MKRGKFYRWLWMSEENALTETRKKKLDRAMKKMPDLEKSRREIRKLSELLSERDYHFRPGFVDRTMTRIASQVIQSQNAELFPGIAPAFKWISIAGVAALFILVFSFYLSQGSLSIESFFGTNSFSDDNLISYLLYQN